MMRVAKRRVGGAPSMRVGYAHWETDHGTHGFAHTEGRLSQLWELRWTASFSALGRCVAGRALGPTHIAQLFEARSVRNYEANPSAMLRTVLAS